MLSKLNQTFLGLTVIAVGNALPDAVTTIALAKQGYGMIDCKLFYSYDGVDWSLW
jgi:Ca2+/Na+ antiporter